MAGEAFPKEGVLALSDSADLPNRTWTFGLPEGSAISGGVYRITFERAAKPEDEARFGSVPEEKWA